MFFDPVIVWRWACTGEPFIVIIQNLLRITKGFVVSWKTCLIGKKSAIGGSADSAALSRRRRGRIRVGQRCGKRVIRGVVGHVIDLGVDIVVVVAGSEIVTGPAFVWAATIASCKYQDTMRTANNQLGTAWNLLV